MHLRRATRHDLPDIATIVGRAMMTDELSLWLSPKQAAHPEVHRERCLRTQIRRYNAGMIMLVIVTDAGDDGWDGSPKIVAYAAYEKEVGASDDSSKVSATLSGAIERFLYRLEDNYSWYFLGYYNTNKARWAACRKAVADAVAASIKLHDKPGRYWELDFLAVDPVFGRRGLGSQLIDWGQQRAIEDDVPLLLWASAQGESLYIRKGFKEVEKIDFGGVVLAPVMRWDPPRNGTDVQ